MQPSSTSTCPPCRTSNRAFLTSHPALLSSPCRPVTSYPLAYPNSYNEQFRISLEYLSNLSRTPLEHLSNVISQMVRRESEIGARPLFCGTETGSVYLSLSDLFALLFSLSPSPSLFYASQKMARTKTHAHTRIHTHTTHTHVQNAHRTHTNAYTPVSS